MLTTTTILYLTLLYAGQPTTTQEFPTPDACIEAAKNLKKLYNGYTKGACVDRNTGKIVIQFDRD